MNKTWSIVLIVVACIVVLGGTYWYFGMGKSKTQQEPTPSVAVEPAKGQPAVAKERPVDEPIPKKDPKTLQDTLPTVPVQAEPATDTSAKKALPAGTLDQKKQLPPPVAPVITRGGGFALPTFGDTSDGKVAEKDAQTSILVIETQPVDTATEEVSEPAIEESPDHELIVTTDDVDMEETPEDTKIEVADETAPPSVEKESLQAEPEVEKGAVDTVVSTPPVAKPPTSKTAFMDTPATDEKSAMEANLSVSFLDYNFPKDFSDSEKSFNVSLDIMSQKEVFGWGGTVEVGKVSSTDVIQLSLLGKATWKLGKGVVTYPLSISLGPTLFIDNTANSTEFGMHAKLSAGITYAISESFRMFYAVGVGATYNFQDSSSFRFVMEPIRVGVGFSF